MDNNTKIKLIKAAITATFVQSFMYGLYVASTLHTLRWLLFGDNGWRIRAKPKFFMIALVALFSLLLTVDLGISVLLTIKLQTSFVFSIVNITIENATILIADGVLIYRCWIIYNNSWKIVLLPIMLWLTDLAFALMFAIFQVSTYLLRQIKIDYQLSMKVWTMFYAFNIAINIYTTFAIVYRICRVARNSASTDRKRLYNISRILAESGLLLTITSAMDLGATVNYLKPIPYLIRPTTDALHFSMTGITFNLILIRIGFEGSKPDYEYTDAKYDVRSRKALSTSQSRVIVMSSASLYPEQGDQDDIQVVQ